tara:strand:+ start:355 stop:540 length:186 start_codon:yes stop_codon:yes gene_type:complete
MYLVSWKGMQKDTEIPLPMRPFSSYQEAECYALGCADVVCVASNSDLKWEDVMRDFIITQD